jgi:hypothetical protein
MRMRTDQELGGLDVPALISAGLGGAGPARDALFGEGAVAAAIAADRLAVRPRSLVFLAEVVRRGGLHYAAELPEPLPGAERTALVRDWLAATKPPAEPATEDAAEPPDGSATEDAAEPAAKPSAAFGADEEFARWLEAVAVLLGLRQHSGPPPGD